MGKNVLSLRCFLATLLLMGTALSAVAEEYANDLWIVEPKAGDNLRNVMQETVDGTNNLAHQQVVIKDNLVTQTATTPEVIRNGVIVQSGGIAPEANPELKGPKQIIRDKIHHQAYMVQSVETPENKAAESAPRVQPVQLIKVPDEAQAKAVLYDDYTNLTVRPDTPRSFNYPIGDERRERDAAMRAEFDPMMRMAEVKNGDNPEHKQAVARYKQAVLDCTRERSEQTSLETNLLDYDGRIYNNAAYLSNTLTETEICLRELGYEIVENMYLNDEEVLRDYEKHAEALHIDSTSVDFNPRFCGENCSLKAVVDAQRTRIAEFQKYLCQLLSESPKDIFVEMDMLEPEDLVNVPFVEGDWEYENYNIEPVKPEPRPEPRVVQRRVTQPQPVARPKFVRNSQRPVRVIGAPAELAEPAPVVVTPNHTPQQYQAQPVARPRREIRQQRALPVVEVAPQPEVPYFEGEEVPMIDESELY